MRFSLLSSTIICLLSFLPHSVAFSAVRSQAAWKQNPAMATTKTQKELCSRRRVFRTILHMGMFEDFLSGQDKSARSQENVAYLKQLQVRVERINALEPSIEDLGDDELVAKTQEFRERLAQGGEDMNGKLLEEAFAVVREASWCVYLFVRSFVL